MNPSRPISLALIGLPLAFAAGCSDSTTPATGSGTSSGAGTTTGAGGGSGSVSTGAGGTGSATTGSISSGSVSTGSFGSGSTSTGSSAGGSGASSGVGGTGSASGAGDGGTEAGTTGCKTDPGMALQFTSTMPDLVQASIANMPVGKASRTIELWAQFDGTANSWLNEHGLFETGDRGPGGGNACHEFAVNSTMSQGALHPYGNCDPVDNFFLAPADAFPAAATKAGWIHVAFAYDMTNNAFLFTINGNGMLMNQPGNPPARSHAEGWPAPANWSTTPYTAADAMTINANALTGNVLSIGTTPQFIGPTGWGGMIDEVRVWSVFRDAATIKANMNVMLKGTETGLVAYYKFDEGKGTTMADATGNATNVAKMVLAGATQPTWPKWVKSDIPGPFTCAP